MTEDGEGDFSFYLYPTPLPQDDLYVNVVAPAALDGQRYILFDTVLSLGPTQTASYDSVLTVPCCRTYGSECNSADLLKGRGTMYNGDGFQRRWDRCGPKHGDWM